MANETISTLASELGADSVIELIQAYLADTPERLGELRHLVATGDQPALRRAAHSIKGSSSIFGIDHVEKSAHALEMSAVQNRRDTQAALLEELCARYDQAQLLLQKTLLELQSAGGQ
jgi:HPt (histidine-containing phosphotransfer) domain-containing protein